MMRSLMGLLMLSVTLAFSAQAAEGFDDLVKLVNAGIGEDVLVAYVETSDKNFELSVDDILYLNDIGTPSKVVAAAVRKSGLQAAALPEAVAPIVNNPNAPLVQPQTVPVDRVAERPVVPSVLPPTVPEDYDRTVREAVQRPTTPGAGYPNAPANDPVIGRPEPVLERAESNEIRSSRPTYTETVADNEPRIIEREVVREVVVEKPVYVSTTTVVAPPEDRLNVSFFYESLSPYGSWVSIDNDYYWQPSVVRTDSSWRPYWNNGHWVYTDYGWTWHSSYSWGWAPFHYGRWNCHPRHGWVWRPDTVWAPAWVHWRSNDAYCGWAPLPWDAHYESGIGFSYRGKNVALDFHFGLSDRDYSFVPYNRFCERDIYRYGAHRHEVVNIYNNTRIVNNYYDYRDRRLVNNGPGYDSIRRGVGRDIKPVRITDANYRAGDAIRPASLRDDSLAVYRPNIRREAPETPQVVMARREQELQRAQAERQAQRERQRTVQTVPTTPQRETPVRTQVTDDRNRLNAETQRAREMQARREAESREEAARQQSASKERIERETREAQRKAQEQTRTVTREDERRTEEARREAQRVQEETRKVVQNEARLQQEREQQARQQQLEAQRKAEQVQRENQRQQERAIEAQAQREQQARQQQVEAQRKAEQAQREAQREAQQQAERQAAQQAQQARQEAQRIQQERAQQAERQAAQQAQQARQEAQRVQQERAQQAQAQRQAEQAQREAQRQQPVQREPVQRQEIQRVPQPQQQPYQPTSREEMRNSRMTEREVARRSR